MKYRFIGEYRKAYGIERLCRVLRASRSGYYKWLKIGLSQRARENQLLSIRILEIFNHNRKVYGFRRIKQSLEREGKIYNHKRILRIMKLKGITAKPTVKFRVTTTDSKGNNLIFPNLLNGKVAQRPNQIIASDITYVRTTDGWLYLAVVIDLFTREVIGYAVDDRMPAELIEKALQNAFKNINGKEVELFHSDRGKQFSSYRVKNILRSNKITQSMSRKANCYDNATVESFFHTLKTEWLYRERPNDKKTTKLNIFKYIEAFYNSRRLHSSLNYCTPREMKSNFELNRIVA